MTVISERIQAAEQRLTALRAKRGAAALDGDDSFDAAEYAAIAAEIEALRDAESVAVHRERSAAAGERQKRQDALRDRIKRLERERLAAVSDAEEAARALVDALKRATVANGKLHESVHEITGKGAMGFRPLDFENRMSAYLAADMRKLKQGPRGGRLGHISWPINPPRQNEVWAVEESRIVKADLAEALK